MQLVQQSRDLFDAVLNGRLEIKKLRINASSDWLASLVLRFFFSLLPLSLLFFFRSTSSSIFSFLYSFLFFFSFSFLSL